LDAAFHVALRNDNTYDIPEAISLVSQKPADAVGLTDRGRIQVGCKADLVWSSLTNDHVHIEHVWKDGNRVF